MKQINVKICTVDTCKKPRKKGDARYCSMHYARLYRTGRLDKPAKPPYLDVIFATSKEMPSGCIEWQGYRNKLGYGRRRFHGKKQLVHRVVYSLSHGGSPIPFGLLVCHTCDNPSCINPSHLFLGTHKDNVQDAIKKGRIDPSQRAKERWIKCPTIKKLPVCHSINNVNAIFEK